jgi:hypothetical protein
MWNFIHVDMLCTRLNNVEGVEIILSIVRARCKREEIHKYSFVSSFFTNVEGRGEEADIFLLITQQMSYVF